MPEVSKSTVPFAEPQVEPNHFAYHLRTIEELFSQKEDCISSLSSKNSINHSDIKEAVGPSFSRKLFHDGIGDGFSVIKKEKLKASLKQGVTVLSQEVDEMLDPVSAMYEIQKHLRDKEHAANNPNSADCDVKQHPCKKQKLSSSPSSTGVSTQAGTLSSQSCDSGSEDMDRKNPDVVSSEESQSRGIKKECLECKTTCTPQWRAGPDGQKTLCNACGIKYKKKKMSPLGCEKVEKKVKQQLDEELQLYLDIGGSQAKDTVKIYADELFAKLGHMEHQLEKYLDVIMSKCRQMTKAEKQELRNLIEKLPPKNRDRVVDIIVQHQKQPNGCPCNEIQIELENEDNVTLWRLYFYAEAVARAKHCLE